MDVEWLLSTLFDASLLSPLSRRKRRLLFCPISGQGLRALQNHFETTADRTAMFLPSLNLQRKV
jgi:hypothetical protein